MSTVGELACSYAVMILEDEGIAITSDKIATLVKAAGVKDVESYWPMLFSKMAEKRNVTDLIMNVGAGGGGGGGAPVSAAPAAAAGGAAADAAPAKEEKKDEPADDSDGDLGFGLFD